MTQQQTTSQAPATEKQVAQIIGTNSVRIVKSKSTGQRAAQIFNPRKGIFYVPVELLSLAAGKDEWMRDIEYRCTNCREKHPARDMECEMCPQCFEKAGEENTESDAR